MRSKTSHSFKNEELEPNFKPSMKTLLCILKTMADSGSEGKTCLAHDANLNYARLAKHIVWLEKKDLVELILNESKIDVSLTDKG